MISSEQVWSLKYFPAIRAIKSLSLNEIESASFIPEYKICLFFYATSISGSSSSKSIRSDKKIGSSIDSLDNEQGEALVELP